MEAVSFERGTPRPETAFFQDPTLDLCLGPYVHHRRGFVSHGRGTSVTRLLHLLASKKDEMMATISYSIPNLCHSFNLFVANGIEDRSIAPVTVKSLLPQMEAPTL